MGKVGKSIIIITIIMFLSMVSCIKVYAAETSISFDGKQEVETNTTQTVTIKVSNETEIGVIQGKISGDTNIEIESVAAKDSNWIVNYNGTTKEFVGYYADGIKSGEVLIVKYKLKSGAAEGRITLSDIVLTTTTYETITKTNIEKTVIAKAGTNNGENENSSNNGANKSSETPGESKSSTTQTTTKTQTKNSKNGIIPKLGQNGLLIIAIIVSVGLAVISYFELKNKN